MSAFSGCRIVVEVLMFCRSRGYTVFVESVGANQSGFNEVVPSRCRRVVLCEIASTVRCDTVWRRATAGQIAEFDGAVAGMCPCSS